MPRVVEDEGEVVVKYILPTIVIINTEYNYVCSDNSDEYVYTYIATATSSICIHTLYVHMT